MIPIIYVGPLKWLQGSVLFEASSEAEASDYVRHHANTAIG